MDHVQVKQTWLSRRPQENSTLVSTLATMMVLLVSTLCWQESRHLYLLLAADSREVFQNHEYWRLLSALLVHADLRHFLSNAVIFSVFGYLLYGYFGGWVFPGATFILGGVINLLSLLTYQPQTVRLVGASGMVYFMASFWLTMYLFLERRYTLGKRLLRTLGVGLIVLMPGAFDQAVSYRTHFIGALVGCASALLFFRAFRATFRSAEVAETVEPEPTATPVQRWEVGSLDEL